MSPQFSRMLCTVGGVAFAVLMHFSSALAQDYPSMEPPPDYVEQQNERQRSACIITGACDQPAQPAGPPAIWGALAISRSSIFYGYSYDYPSPEAANASALEHCNAGLKGKRDCQIQSTFSRNCIALATSDDGAWGLSATYGDLVADDRDALGRCQNAGGKSCATVLGYCSPNAGFHTWVGLAISNEAHPKAGISWGAPAQSTASKLAFDNCIKDGGSNCKVRMLLYNQCVAFAASPNGMWGAYNHVSRQLAESNAIRKCHESNGTNCAILLSKCSADSVN
jgi:Domain of unknown function (DUF4189)